MKAYEAIKLLKVDRKEFLQTHELKSHMSKISEELEAELFGVEKKIQAEPEPAQSIDSTEAIADVAQEAPEIPVEAITQPKATPSTPECPVSLETLATSLRGLGGKSPYYKWKYLLNA